MDTHTLIRLVVGLGMTAVVLVFAARRVLWLTNLIRSGQKTSDERGRKNELGTRIATQIKEVFGQTRLLKWSIPGLAHFFTFWAFVILATVYLEAYGALFNRDFAIPVIGHWATDPKRIPTYEAGSWGPHEADRLIERDGRGWRNMP